MENLMVTSDSQFSLLLGSKPDTRVKVVTILGTKPDTRVKELTILGTKPDTRVKVVS